MNKLRVCVCVTESRMCHNKPPSHCTTRVFFFLPLTHLMAVLCYCMFHQQRRVAGGRDPAFGGAEKGFVCFSLHARSLFVACWRASSLPSASLSLSLTAPRPCFEGRGRIKKIQMGGKKKGRKETRCRALTSPARILQTDFSF